MRLLVSLLLALFFTGCATLPPGSAISPEAFDDDARRCLDMFNEADRRVETHQVRDAGATPVEGFPWLRTDRFLASFGNALDGDDERWRAWLNHLRRTDLVARRYELANASGAHPFGQTVEDELDALDGCTRVLNDALLANDALRDALLPRVEVPDDYRTWQRWLGLYPLTRVFVLAGVHRLHADKAETLVAPPAAADDTRWRSYASAARIADTPARLASARRDALGIPEPEPRDLDGLLDRHAPVWRIETRSDDDRPGRPVWRTPERPEVRTDEPVEYRFVTWTRFDGQVLAQLNYLIWYPARSPEGRFDIFAGHMDGTLWRVTLDADGEPLAGESLHACGCYYLVFPGERLTEREPQPGGEPVFIGEPLPQTGPNTRLRLTRAAANHYLVHLDTIKRDVADDASIRLRVTDADRLRSLAHPDGRRSLYRPDDGLVPGTARPERWLLWPMGVPSAGAMRQPGRHAIAFASRRHFDAPELLAAHFQRTEAANDTRNRR